MGNYINKKLNLVSADESQGESIEKQVVAQQATTQDTKIYTPTMPDKKLLLDPRSISVGISRTPIEV